MISVTHIWSPCIARPPYNDITDKVWHYIKFPVTMKCFHHVRIKIEDSVKEHVGLDQTNEPR